MSHYLYTFELKRKVPKAKPAKEQSSVHWGQAGSAGLVEAKEGEEGSGQDNPVTVAAASDHGFSQR